MRIQITSDLHGEFREKRRESLSSRPSPLVAKTDADVLILAGDIHQGVQAVEYARELAEDLGIPVLLVPGNHEFYGGEFTDTLAAMRAAVGEGVHVLARDTVILQGVRFLGCILWCDFCLFGRERQEDAMAEAQMAMNDFWLIRHQGERLGAEAMLQWHLDDRAWLEGALATAWDGPTVVITHHGPAPGSVAARFQRHELTPAFVSDLTPSIQRYQPALWVHGHTHTAFDYSIGRTRVVCNPAGYPSETVHSREPWLPGYSNACVVEVA